MRKKLEKENNTLNYITLNLYLFLSLFKNMTIFIIELPINLLYS